MGRPMQQVDVFTIQARRDHGKVRPWVVRWRVDGQQRTLSFRTRVEAGRHRSLLIHAVTTGRSSCGRARRVRPRPRVSSPRSGWPHRRSPDLTGAHG